jgi:hypothetical protein
VRLDRLVGIAGAAPDAADAALSDRSAALVKEAGFAGFSSLMEFMGGITSRVN